MANLIHILNNKYIFTITIIITILLATQSYSYPISANASTTSDTSNNIIPKYILNSVSNSNNAIPIPIHIPLILSGYYMGSKCQYINHCSKNDIGDILQLNKFLGWLYVIGPIKRNSKTANINNSPYIDDDIYSKIKALDTEHILIYINTEFIEVPHANIKYDTITNILYVKLNNNWTPITTSTIYYTRLPYNADSDYDFASIIYNNDIDNANNIDKKLVMTQIHCINMINDTCSHFTTRIIRGKYVFIISSIIKANGRWVESSMTPYDNKELLINLNSTYASLILCVLLISNFVILFHIDNGNYDPTIIIPFRILLFMLGMGSIMVSFSSGFIARNILLVSWAVIILYYLLYNPILIICIYFKNCKIHNNIKKYQK